MWINRKSETHRSSSADIINYRLYRLQWLRYVTRSADRVVVMGLIAQDW